MCRTNISTNVLLWTKLFDEKNGKAMLRAQTHQHLVFTSRIYAPGQNEALRQTKLQRTKTET